MLNIQKRLKTFYLQNVQKIIQIQNILLAAGTWLWIVDLVSWGRARENRWRCFFFCCCCFCFSQNGELCLNCLFLCPLKYFTLWIKHIVCHPFSPCKSFDVWVHAFKMWKEFIHWRGKFPFWFLLFFHCFSSSFFLCYSLFFHSDLLSICSPDSSSKNPATDST